MEVRVYASLESFRANKAIYCAHVLNPDSFSYDSCLSVFRAIYGNVIVVFVCV